MLARPGTHALVWCSVISLCTSSLHAQRAAQPTPPASGKQACTVQTRTFTADIVHAGTLQVVVDVPFCAPVSMEGVSLVVLETLIAEITSTSAASQSVNFAVELMDSGSPVASLAPASGNQSGNLTSHRNFILRTSGELNSTAVVNGIRLTSTVSATSLSVRYRGAYQSNTIRAHFARGPIGDGDCHAIRAVANTSPVVVTGTGTSAWVEQSFDVPVPLANLHFVLPNRPGFSITGSIGDSFDIEAQLLLDNKETLQMDNWSVPGAAAAPPAQNIWAREVRRTIAYPQCLELEDRVITGWRWRVHKTGSGTLTMTPGDPIFIRFLRKPCEKPGDFTGDGIVDVLDLLYLLGSWGACADPEHCPADLNGDCTVDVIDLLVVLANWG
ncbi:MAG TPA: hypothetical protein PK098_03555 [Phycisphaerales bacterium]|nr:hypothetical protein [Phycisphaerales bacterium]